jgi:hypothetical protein
VTGRGCPGTRTRALLPMLGISEDRWDVLGLGEEPDDVDVIRATK